MKQKMEIVGVELEEDRGGILITGTDKVEQVLAVFYAEIAKQKAGDISQIVCNQLNKPGSYFQTNERQSYFSTPDIKIILLDQEKNQYLLRVINSVLQRIDKKRESWLAEKLNLQSVLFGFSVKLRIKPIDGKFFVDFTKILQPLNSCLPLKKLEMSEVVSSFMESERYSIHTGTTEPLVIYQDDDLRLSLNFDKTTSGQRFDRSCILKSLMDPKDMWYQDGTTVVGPFVPAAEVDLSLPTLVLSIENTKSLSSDGMYEPIIGEKAEKSARDLSSIVAAAFSSEK